MSKVGDFVRTVQFREENGSDLLDIAWIHQEMDLYLRTNLCKFLRPFSNFSLSGARCIISITSSGNFSGCTAGRGTVPSDKNVLGRFEETCDNNWQNMGQVIFANLRSSLYDQIPVPAP